MSRLTRVVALLVGLALVLLAASAAFAGGNGAQTFTQNDHWLPMVLQPGPGEDQGQNQRHDQQDRLRAHTFNIHGIGSDGSLLDFHRNDQATLNANGVVTVSFSKGGCG